MDKHPLMVTTFNMHKGMSPLNRQFKLTEIASALETLSPDLVLLQEVQGKNNLRALKHENWINEPQHQYLARKLGHISAYGLNANYDHGHHGNAILSRYPLQVWHNIDLSVNRFESRGILSCRIQPIGWIKPVLVLCGHFNLLAHDRKKQYKTLSRFIQSLPETMPLILAGDFNDWRQDANRCITDELGLTDVFQQKNGHLALSFPARFPILALDRIYVRGLKPIDATVQQGAEWRLLSDHLPLTTKLLPSRN